MLTVVAVIGILAAILLTALAWAGENGRRAACASNLKQVNLAIRLYADDRGDSLPVLEEPNLFPNGVGAYYKQLVKGYLGLSGPASPSEKVFVCPSDRVEWTNITHAFTSYTFNGYEVSGGAIGRITGQRFSAIRSPSKGVLAGEFPAFWGGAWHPMTPSNRPESQTVLSYVDGHLKFAKIYWDGITDSRPCTYEPPAGYDYSWDGR
jgi:type II secretory pathway pseudopilin PulG